MLALAAGLAFAMSFTALPQRALGLLWVVLLLAAAAIAPCSAIAPAERSRIGPTTMVAVGPVLGPHLAHATDRRTSLARGD